MNNLEGMKELFENEIYTNSNRLREKFISKNYAFFHSFININYDGESFLQKIYNFHKGIHYCICGKKTKFIDFKKGYLSFCSVKCSSNSEETRNKSRKTIKEKYGVDNISKLDSVKEKKKIKSYEKYGISCHLQSDFVKNILLEKYGVDNPFKDDEIQEKIKKNNIKKYGFKSPLKSLDIIEKIKKTNIKKYGFDHFSKTETWKEKIKSKNDEIYVNSLCLSDDYLFLSKKRNINKIKHIDCGNIFEIQTQLIRLRRNKEVEICRHCNKINHLLENDLTSYIKSIYDGELMKYRDKKFEIDVYLPELNIGFEFNGLYWHSELFKDKEYHKNKMNYFKKKGIRIINIWEDDWLNESDVIKSIISKNIRKNEMIDSNDCEFIEVSDLDCMKFLKENHIKGSFDHMSIHKYALLYKGDIVSLLLSKMEENEIEISFCNKINTTVINGFSKLFKSLKDDIVSGKIVIKIDLSIFKGDVFIKNGFKEIDYIEPTFSHVVKGIRTDLKKLKKFEILENNYKIYNCGYKKLEFNF